MARYKRKLEDFDPNRSDSDDLDYGAAESPPAKRPQRTARKAKGGTRAKKRSRRESYVGSDDEIEYDSIEDDEAEEESYGDDEEDEEDVVRNPRTGRSVRTAARKAIKYEEESGEDDDNDDLNSADGDQDAAPAKTRAPATAQLLVKLKVPSLNANNTAEQQTARTTRSRTGSKSLTTRAPTPAMTGTRRSSRISRSEDEPLQALPATGTRSRRGTATPEPAPGATKRPTRGTKGLRNMPSAILEESMEASQLLPQHQGAAGTAPADDDDIKMEHIVQESQDDDDDAPVVKGGSRKRSSRKGSENSEPAHKRPRRAGGATTKSQKPAAAEAGSDFEPDPAEGEEEADVAITSGDESLRSSRPISRASTNARRSARNTKGKAGKSRRPSTDSELDSDEIADEAADLEDEEKRKKRGGRRKPATITYEAERKSLRARKEKVDYRMRSLAEFTNNDQEQDDAADYQPVGSQQAPVAAPKSRRRADRDGYRSMFSTGGPFGGYGDPPAVLGGSARPELAGGADSDSSEDDEGGAQALPGATSMTPNRPMQKPGALTGPGGGPPDLGRVKDKQPLADTSSLGEDPSINFDNVGGLDGHIDQLKEMCSLPLLYPEVYQKLGIKPPSGVLFHGPPGTGKTMLARALSHSISSHGKKVTFYVRKGADALSKWVGEAEKQLRILFEDAKKNQPSIIFFDEIDGLAPVRSSKQDQIHASIVSTLLALMDGMDSRGQVIILGATNRPDSVDPALRRPGRFDREFYFPLPNQEARRAIINIHTRAWDPPLEEEFKDKLASLTKGYGGADLRALCVEAALNAVQGTYPQIYTSKEKLLIDPAQIKVLAKDFMLSIDRIVPSSLRSTTSTAAPLKKGVEPLLRLPLAEIFSLMEKSIPRKRKVTALEEAMYDDRDDEFGFERHEMQREFESSRIFRPRLLIKGSSGMGQNYLAGAVMAKLEGLHVQDFGLSVVMADNTRSQESVIVQLFEEVRRHKPSIIYIPDVQNWYEALSDSARRTFTGLLRAIHPAEPILLLGYIELDDLDQKLNPEMVRNLFGHSMKNQYELSRPNEAAREEYFTQVVDMVRKTPKQFPDPSQRKRRKLAELPLAPAPPPAPTVEQNPKAAEKLQKKKDRQTLNKLKMVIQPVMEQMKKYRIFKDSPIDDTLIRYLYDEQDPNILSSDLTEEQRQEQALFRPYEVDTDEKGVQGLRETATGKFYYNLNMVVIEQRLSNGYYKRPKDFVADIKRLAKDAKTLGNQQRTLKANELHANVDVDMAVIEESNPALLQECVALYEREQQRERERLRKEAEAKAQGQNVSAVVPNVPPQNASHTTTEGSGPVVLGQEIPGVNQLLPVTPSRLPGPSPISTDWSNPNGGSNFANSSTAPSKPNEDSGMYEVSPNDHAYQQGYGQQNTQEQRSQRGAHTQLAHGSQFTEYQNSASTTTSGQKTSDRSRISGPYSNNTPQSNSMRPGGDHPDFSTLAPTSGGSQLPDTQELNFQSSQEPASQSSQPMGPPPHRASIHNLLNTNTQEEVDNLYTLEEKYVEKLHRELTTRSSGLTVEQLEQVSANIMYAIYNTREEWNRNLVVQAVQSAFNESVMDIEDCQKVHKASQEELLEMQRGRAYEWDRHGCESDQ